MTTMKTVITIKTMEMMRTVMEAVVKTIINNILMRILRVKYYIGKQNVNTNINHTADSRMNQWLKEDIPDDDANLGQEDSEEQTYRENNSIQS